MSPFTGAFTSRDTWDGDANLPMSYNRWMYVYGNPVNYTDPSGMSVACGNGDTGACGGETKESKYFNERKFYENCAKYGGEDCPPWGEIILYTTLGLTGVAILADIVCPTLAIPLVEGVLPVCLTGNCYYLPGGLNTSIDFLTNRFTKVRHIMQGKHAWDLVAILTGDVTVDYITIQPILRNVINYGLQIVAKTNSQGFINSTYQGDYGGYTIVVTTVELVSKVITIVDAWVVTR